MQAKVATLCCDRHKLESVHSNEGLRKVLRLYVALMKYYHQLKMELPLPISSKPKYHTLTRYFIALVHTYTASNIYEKNNRSVWQFDKLWHCQEMASRVPEWLYSNDGWLSMTNKDSIKYSATFNRGKWMQLLLKSSDISEMWLAILYYIEQSSKSSKFTLAWEKFVQDKSQNCWITSTNGTEWGWSKTSCRTLWVASRATDLCSAVNVSDLSIKLVIFWVTDV